MICISPSHGTESHLSTVARNITDQSSQDRYKDVFFHCQNNKVLSAYKVVLASASPLLAELFRDASEPVYSIFCPEFEAEALNHLFEILFTGETKLPIHNRSLLSDIQEIMKTLEVKIDLVRNISTEKERKSPPVKDEDSVADDPIACAPCGKPFTEEGVLNELPKTKVKTYRKKSRELKKFEFIEKLDLVCQHCDANFASKKKLNIHLKTKECNDETMDVVESPADDQLEDEMNQFAITQSEQQVQEENGERTSDDMCINSEEENCEDGSAFEDSTLDQDAENVAANEEQSFICTTCNESFLSSLRYKQHVLDHYKDQTASKDHDAPYYRCHVCDEYFAIRDDAVDHLLSVHNVTKPFECDECSQLFATALHLNKHVSADHQETEPVQDFEASDSDPNIDDNNFYSNHSELTFNDSGFSSRSLLSPETSTKRPKMSLKQIKNMMKSQKKPAKKPVDHCKKCNGRKSEMFKRRTRCRQCPGCKAPKCMTCKFCTIPSMKKSCALRVCQVPVMPKCLCPNE